MNLPSHPKNYGRLALSATLVRSIQLEWAMIESPAPRPRFLNFPLADDPVSAPVAAAAPVAREEKGELAA
jgi:hypothetical protein